MIAKTRCHGSGPKRCKSLKFKLDFDFLPERVARRPKIAGLLT